MLEKSLKPAALNEQLNLQKNHNNLSNLRAQENLNTSIFDSGVKMSLQEVVEVQDSSFGHDGPSNDLSHSVPTTTTQTVNKNSSSFLPPIQNSSLKLKSPALI
jgi:hypothetical protein